MERSGFRLLEKSSPTTYCCLCIVYTVLVVAFAYWPIAFAHMLVVVGLLGTSSIYLLV